MTHPHRRLHLGGRLGQDDRLRHAAVAGEAVALVRAHLRRLRDDRIGADRAFEFGDEAHVPKLLHQLAHDHLQEAAGAVGGDVGRSV